MSMVILRHQRTFHLLGGSHSPSGQRLWKALIPALLHPFFRTRVCVIPPLSFLQVERRIRQDMTLQHTQAMTGQDMSLHHTQVVKIGFDYC